MPVRRPRTRDIVAANLAALMGHAQWSQRDLEAKSGVSQRQISNILTRSTSCSVETADALARAFGLEGWHLLVKDLPDDLVHSVSIAKLVAAYIQAGQETRNYIDTVAQRETVRGGD